MTTALVDVYDTVRDHLDAYAIADHLVPLLIGEKRWIPEFESEGLLLHRIFLAEKWLVARLHYGHIDPREAGVGNIVNCGATMYVAPIGIVNAGSPDAAYAEAIDVAGAHQSSYGREAAGVYAAAVAEAMRPGASVDERRGRGSATRQGRHARRDRGRRRGGGRASPTGASGLGVLRAAVEPFDTVGPNYRQPARDARIPSRTKSIEELPVALGMLVAAQGDYREAVLGSINYGRDSDSIAVMAGSLAGALGGVDVVPAEWIDGVSAGSRMDITATGPVIASVARDVWAADAARARAGRRRPARRSRPTSRSRRCSASAGPSPKTCCRTRWSPPSSTAATVADLRERWVAAGGAPEAAVSGATPQPATPALREARARAAGRRSTSGPTRRRWSPRSLTGSTRSWRLRRAGRRRRPRAALPATSLERPGARRVAGPGIRMPARQAGREDLARGHPRDRPVDRELADRRRTSPRSDSTPTSRRAIRGTGGAADEPRREHRRDARRRRPELPADRARPARSGRRRVHDRRRRAVVAGQPARRARLHGRAHRLPQPARRLRARRRRRGAEPVPRLDRRADPHRRVRLGEPGRPGRRCPPGLDGRAPEPRPQRSVRCDVRRGRLRGRGRRRRRSREVLEAGLSVVPAGSRYAAAIARGVELGAGDLDDEAAIDALHAEFGHLHWVHALEQLRPARLRPHARATATSHARSLSR